MVVKVAESDTRIMIRITAARQQIIDYEPICHVDLLYLITTAGHSLLTTFSNRNNSAVPAEQQ